MGTRCKTAATPPTTMNRTAGEDFNQPEETVLPLDLHFWERRCISSSACRHSRGVSRRQARKRLRSTPYAAGVKMKWAPALGEGGGETRTGTRTVTSPGPPEP